MPTKKTIQVDQSATRLVGLMAHFGGTVFTFPYTAVLQKSNVITTQ